VGNTHLLPIKMQCFELPHFEHFERLPRTTRTF
jgi:hypothetical protein